MVTRRPWARTVGEKANSPSDSRPAPAPNRCRLHRKTRRRAQHREQHHRQAAPKQQRPRGRCRARRAPRGRTPTGSTRRRPVPSRGRTGWRVEALRPASSLTRGGCSGFRRISPVSTAASPAGRWEISSLVTDLTASDETASAPWSRRIRAAAGQASARSPRRVAGGRPPRRRSRSARRWEVPRVWPHPRPALRHASVARFRSLSGKGNRSRGDGPRRNVPAGPTPYPSVCSRFRPGSFDQVMKVGTDRHSQARR